MKFNTVKNDIKSTWRIINSVSKQDITPLPSKFVHDDKEFTDSRVKLQISLIPSLSILVQTC